ncbi:MAG: DUF4911 domain-containing protein, partial [Desulfobacterales bacterium]|nr:DUF4911 domain-containing protein [Desulfobacterales bacterium]
METIRRIYRIDPGEIAYLRMTVESYDGMAMVSTVDPDEALVELKISPGCEELISELLKDLTEREEGMGLAPFRGASACDQCPPRQGDMGLGGDCPARGTNKGSAYWKKTKERGTELLPKRYYIATMGCQMNEYDSDYVGQVLQNADFSPTEDPEEADLILINTCTVRARAEQKAVSLLGRLLGLKKKRPDIIIGLMGCVAQHRGPTLLQRFPGLDLVLGTGEITRITEALDKVGKDRERMALTDAGHRPRPPGSRPGYFRGKVKSFVSVMEGCDNFCSYCIVPYVRGREVSRPPDEVV